MQSSNVVRTVFNPDGSQQMYDKQGNLVDEIKRQKDPNEFQRQSDEMQRQAATAALQRKYLGTDGGSASVASGGSTDTKSSLFGGDINGLSGTFDALADKNIGRAKDWAQFQLGLNAQQGEQDYGFRNREATRDFGFQTSLAGQQIEGNRSLENLRQTSETDRLQRSLTNQQTMQQSDFTNQTQQRAQQAALARIGFRGR